MPRPTEPVKRVCYVDDLTVWATGVKIPDLEDSINSIVCVCGEVEVCVYVQDKLVCVYV